jgi:hypothetical protein
MIVRREESVKYETPRVTDFGAIGDHTFDVPGKGDKGECGNDPMWNEPSCPDGS